MNIGFSSTITTKTKAIEMVIPASPLACPCALSGNAFKKVFADLQTSSPRILPLEHLAGATLLAENEFMPSRAIR